MAKDQSIFFEASPDLLAIVDFDFRLVQVNPSWSRVLGWAVADLGLSSIWKIIDPGSIEPVLTCLSGVMTKGSPVETEVVCLTLEKGAVRLNWRLVRSLSEPLLLVTASEVARIDQRSDSTAPDTDGLEAIFHGMSEGIVIQGRDGQVERYNRAALAILNVTASELLGTSTRDPRWRAVDADMKPLSKELHPANVCRKTGIPVMHQVVGVDSPGRGMTWMKVSASPLYVGEDGIPEKTVVTFSDITALKCAEIKLKQIFQNIPIGVAMLDKDLRFLEVNPAYQKWIGFSAAELKRMCVDDVPYFEDIKLNNKFSTKTGEPDGVQSRTLAKRYVSKGGEILWGKVTACRLKRVENPDDYLIFSAIEDVTAAKKADIALDGA